jgi:hypothetical protein
VKKVVGCGKSNFVLWKENAVANVSVGGPTSLDVLAPEFHGELGEDT